MSKSVGNVVAPEEIAERYGADALRYYLMREIPFWSDGAYSEEKLVRRFNHDLGNDLGNLVLRTLSMLERYFEGKIPPRPGDAPEEWGHQDRALRGSALEVQETMGNCMDALEFNRALDAIWELVRMANRYVEESQPWALAKNPEKRAQLETVMYNLAEACRVIAVYLSPFMPTTCESIRRQFGLSATLRTLAQEVPWVQSEPGTPVHRSGPLFPRVE